MASPTSDRRLGLVGNVAIKAPVAVVATVAVAQAGTQTIDGVPVASGDRVLCTAQADATTNGIWDVSTAAWTRSADADGVYDLACGSIVGINKGSHASQVWMLTTPDPVSIGSSALVWSMSLSLTFLATLGGGGGAALVGFLQAGANAQLRTTLDKMREVEVSISDYTGYDATLATASDVAIQAAIDYCHGLPNGGTVRLLSCKMGTVTMRDNVAFHIPQGAVVQQVQPGSNVQTGFLSIASVSHVHFFGQGVIDGGRVDPASAHNTSNHAITFIMPANAVVNDISVTGITIRNCQEDAIRFLANDLTALAQDIRVRDVSCYTEDASRFDSAVLVTTDLIRLQQADAITNGYGTFQFKHILISGCRAEQIRTLADLKRGCAFFVVSDCRTKNMYDCHHSFDGSKWGTFSGLVGEIETTTTISNATFTNFMEGQGEHVTISSFSFYGGNKTLNGIYIHDYDRVAGHGAAPFKIKIGNGLVDAITTVGYKLQNTVECVVTGCEASFTGSHVATLETNANVDGGGNPIIPIGNEIGDINNKNCTSGVAIDPAAVGTIYEACFDQNGQDFFDIPTTPSGATTLLLATQSANFLNKHAVQNLNRNPSMGPVAAGAISFWGGSATVTTGVAPPNAPYGLQITDSSTSVIQTLDYNGTLQLAQNDYFYFRADACMHTTSQKFGIYVKEFNSTGGQLGITYWNGKTPGSTSFAGWTFRHTGQDAACDHITLGIAPSAAFAGDAATTGTMDIGNVEFGRQAFGAL